MDERRFRDLQEQVGELRAEIDDLKRGRERKPAGDLDRLRRFRPWLLATMLGIPAVVYAATISTPHTFVRTMP